MSDWHQWTLSLRRWLPGAAGLPEIPDDLWQVTVSEHHFLEQLSAEELLRLRELCAHFLKRKEFSGANGLEITDAMAMTVAVQACVLLLHWGEPAQAIRWYDGFVGIILHPGSMRAHRTVRDAAGVTHHYSQDLLGEAMERGPVTLSWDAIVHDEALDGHPERGRASNVVIHEFAHKLDMANGGADGCPPLPAGFMGLHSAAEGKQLWASTWQAAYDHFCEQVAAHDRFGQPAPWLDRYAATNPVEFFAVACEGYWVAPAQFTQAFPTLKPLLDAMFQRPTATATEPSATTPTPATP